MRLGILLVDKVDIVGADELHPVLLAVFLQVLVHFELKRIRFVVGTGDGCLVQLQLQVIVVPEDTLVPLHGLLRFRKLSGTYLAGHLATQTGGADNQPFVVFLQLDPVGTRTHVVALGPGF